MHILIVTQHFPPERGAVRRLYEFARYFVRQGHQVSVLTAMPNYPDGIVPDKYRGKLFYYEEMEGVKVYRSWVLPASNSQPKRRMVGFITFLVTALLNSFRVKGKIDLVLPSSPPVNTPVVGYLLSKLRRARLVIEVRDLQPESSEEFGNLDPSLFTRLLKRLMHGLYRRAERIVTAWDGIEDYLKKIGIPPERITTIRSGFSMEFFTADTNGIRNKFGWHDKFLVLYAGTLGRAHPLETLVVAAKHLRDHPDIMFVFVGDGEKRPMLEAMAKEYQLTNVVFTGTQPLESIPYFLKASDVLIAALRNVPVAQGALPAKLFEYMASGRPIVFGSDHGAVVDELEQAGGALAFPTQDWQSLVRHILDLKQGRVDGSSLGKQYQTYATTHYLRETWANRYLEFLTKA